MKQLKSSLHNLRHLFSRSITIREITEPLASFDYSQPAKEVRLCMEERGFDVVGIRKQGVIVGYVNREELQDDIAGAYLRAFERDQIISENEPLLEAFKALQERRSIFINVIGHIGGIVTRGDLQKTPVRLWLFGLVSLTEMQMLRLIRDGAPDDPWKSLLTEERLAAARKIFDDRRKRREENDLSDCLQFTDKATILLKDGKLYSFLGFASKSAAEKFFKQVRNLRDSLAHSNDILNGDWPELAELVGQLETVLERLEKANTES